MLVVDIIYPGKNGGNIPAKRRYQLSEVKCPEPEKSQRFYEASSGFVRQFGIPFTGNLADHHEDGPCTVIKLANGWVMAGTEVARIGGMQVQGDGDYIIADGLIFHMGYTL